MNFILRDVVYDPSSYKLELDSVMIPHTLASSAPTPDMEALAVRSRYRAPCLEGGIPDDSISFDDVEEVHTDEDIY